MNNINKISNISNKSPGEHACLVVLLAGELRGASVLIPLGRFEGSGF